MSNNEENKSQEGKGKEHLPPFLEKIWKSQPEYLWIIEGIAASVIVGYIVYAHFNTQATSNTSNGTAQAKKHHRPHTIRVPVGKKQHQHQHHAHKLMENDGNVGGIGGGYIGADVEQGETSSLHYTHPQNSHKLKPPMGTNELPHFTHRDLFPGGIDHISGQDFWNVPGYLASAYPWELMTDGQGGGNLYG